MIRISFHFSIRVYTGTAEGKNKIVRKQEGQPSAAFSDIISQAIDRLIPTRSKSTIDNYRMALRSLKEYFHQNQSVTAPHAKVKRFLLKDKMLKK
jgi:hypothetical protein